MIFYNDFCFAVIIKNEVLYVIQQIFGSQRPTIKYSKLVEFF